MIDDSDDVHLQFYLLLDPNEKTSRRKEHLHNWRNQSTNLWKRKIKENKDFGPSERPIVLVQMPTWPTFKLIIWIVIFRIFQKFFDFSFEQNQIFAKSLKHVKICTKIKNPKYVKNMW